MTRSALSLAHVMASEKSTALARRQRLSLGELATIFLASGACASVPRDIMERARCVVSVGQADSIIIGPTFGDTVSLNRPFLDLYEDMELGRRSA